MKLLHPVVAGLTGLGAASLIRCWMSTLEYRAAWYDRAADPMYSFRGHNLYLLWHEFMLFPLYMRGNCNATFLLSRHGDAEVLSRAALHLGFKCVRGSTARGGVQALRELVAKSRDGHLAITPDGPRGPRRSMAPGPIYLASKLNMPLVLMGFGYDQPWRVRSWDRFAIPRPYSRARSVCSAPITLPRRLDRSGIEHYRVEMERLLNRLTLEAEAWAESGTRKRDEIPERRQHSQRGPLRFDQPHRHLPPAELWQPTESMSDSVAVGPADRKLVG